METEKKAFDFTPLWHMHPIVFPCSAGLLFLFVLFSASAPQSALMVFSQLQQSISHYFAWLYIGAMSFFLLFTLWLGLSRFGTIKLSSDDEEPEFRTSSWFAMLFSAGMGIGMLFFGVAEPMYHFLAPPTGAAESLSAAKQAMGLTIFHWGFHPWALYALVALCLAYFSYRKKLPLSFRSVFYPILGDSIFSWPGHCIDILAVLATLFGLATSLGLGAKQINAGLNHVVGLPQTVEVQVILIACITSMAVASLVSGLNSGIRRLSEANMLLASLLLLFILCAGPTVYLMNALVENTGIYLSSLTNRAFWTATYEPGSRASWFGNWTVFYWGWWIAWSPFVGMFIARISKGRTIREFVAGVLIVPVMVSVVWMTVFGNGALHQEISEKLGAKPYAKRTYYVQVLNEKHNLPQTADGKWLVAKGLLLKEGKNNNLVTNSGRAVSFKHGVLIDKKTGIPFDKSSEKQFTGAYKTKEELLGLGGYLTKPVVNENKTYKIDTTATAMFIMLSAYPLVSLATIIATLSIILFFVTSSDSASLVADIIASGGNESPPTSTRLFWGILEGILAAILLIAGGLKALQTCSITAGLPFCVIILLMCPCLYRSLSAEFE